MTARLAFLVGLSCGVACTVAAGAWLNAALDQSVAWTVRAEGA